MPRDTSRVDKFCELVARGGLSLSEAYVQAGYSGKASPKCLKGKAWRLAEKNRDKIDTLKKAIRQLAEEENLWSREQAIDALKLVINDCKKDGELKEKRAYIAACAELNKMCGHYAPDKHEVRAAGLEDNSIDEVLRNLGYAK